MDLSYEETMRRIAHYEKTDPIHRKICKTISKPYRVSIYQGEGQMLIVPLTQSIGWSYAEMARYWQITEVKNSLRIGEIVLEAMKYITERPVDARRADEQEDDSIINQATKCKTYKTFNKKYLKGGVHYLEDGTYFVTQTRRLSGNNGYGGVVGTDIVLAESVTALDIGNAVVQSFDEMERFYSL